MQSVIRAMMGPVKREHASPLGFRLMGSSGCEFFFQLLQRYFLELAGGMGLESVSEPHDSGEKREKWLVSFVLEGEPTGQGRGGDLWAQEMDV